MQKVTEFSLPKKIVIGMAIILILNSLMLARSVELIRFPGESDDLDSARKGAMNIVSYSQNLARERELTDNNAVRESIAKLKYEIERAKTPGEVAQISLRLGREAQDVILREHEIQQGQTILNIINQDPKIKTIGEEPVKITLTRTDESGISIDDPFRILSEETKSNIKQDPKLQKHWQLIEVTVSNGKANLLTARTMLERMKMVQDELDSLRLRFQELQSSSGMAETTGAGIVAKIFDAPDGYTAGEIVHDYDVRDIVNELFASGATAVEVGNQRIIVTSSIRCVGPVILVNQQPIPVNPVVIKAIGEPTVLTSGLDIIKNNFAATNRTIEITREESITLSAYSPSK